MHLTDSEGDGWNGDPTDKDESARVWLQRNVGGTWVDQGAYHLASNALVADDMADWWVKAPPAPPATEGEQAVVVRCLPDGDYYSELTTRVCEGSVCSDILENEWELKCGGATATSCHRKYLDVGCESKGLYFSVSNGVCSLNPHPPPSPPPLPPPLSPPPPPPPPAPTARPPRYSRAQQR